ncbi:hypothetical protein KAR48_02325 [bacterium]|nr:hypothetical protein [bacterium]
MKEKCHIHTLQKILVGVLIITIFSMQFGLFAWGHFHTDENGNTIYHAHPMSADGSGHSHSKTEIAALDQILLTLSIILFGIILLGLILNQLRFTLPQHNRHEVRSIWLIAIFHRGPPPVTMAL